MLDLVTRIREQGYIISDLSDLRKSGIKYIDLIPLLMDAYHCSMSNNEKDGIIRALLFKWAPPDVLDFMIDAFRGERDVCDTGNLNLLAWTIGNAIEIIWDDRRFEDLRELALDRKYGGARQMIILGLARSNDPRVLDICASALDDPNVNGHAASVLSKGYPPGARPALEALVNDQRNWVRNAAKKALKNSR